MGVTGGQTGLVHVAELENEVDKADDGNENPRRWGRS